MAAYALLGGVCIAGGVAIYDSSFEGLLAALDPDRAAPEPFAAE